MKSIYRPVLAVFFICLFAFSAVPVFAEENITKITKFSSSDADDYDEEESDDYDDGYYDTYKQNGAGDQFITVRIGPNFPLNFGENMLLGGQIVIGYHRFLTDWMALGGELAFGYNPTIGGNMYTYIPMMLGVTFLPSAGKFEFPLTFNVGMAMENYLSYCYFPGLVLRPGAGVYYRFKESWSVGAECFFTWLPQWYVNEPSKDDYLNMLTASIGVKYHF